MIQRNNVDKPTSHTARLKENQLARKILNLQECRRISAGYVHLTRSNLTFVFNSFTLQIQCAERGNISMGLNKAFTRFITSDTRNEDL